MSVEENETKERDGWDPPRGCTATQRPPQLPPLHAYERAAAAAGIGRVRAARASLLAGM
jgi:hypothetical protein